jgi:hypothetical protein
LKGDPQWLYPVLLNGWANYGSGLAQASYRTVGNVVQLRGTVKSTNPGQIIAYQSPPNTNKIIKAIYGPPFISSFIVVSNNAAGRVDVWPDGSVAAVAGYYPWFALDSIVFRAV